MRLRFIPILALVLAIGTGCASARTGGGAVRTALADRSSGLPGVVEAPFQDLNIRRPAVAPILLAAAEAPYGLRGLWTCEAVEAEVAALDAALGPDVDQAAPEPEHMTRLANSLAGAAVGEARRATLGMIPGRGLVRQLSGAARAEQVERNARLAGSVRRGFLRALRLQMGCVPATAAPGIGRHGLPLPAYAVAPPFGS